MPQTPQSAAAIRTARRAARRIRQEAEALDTLFDEIEDDGLYEPENEAELFRVVQGARKVC